VLPSRHPLGPIVRVEPAWDPPAARRWAALVLAGALGVLAVAVWLVPSAEGLGTHRQLGFPACSAITVTGYPCPSCGMTTAFSYTVRGRWVSAFHAQPAGFGLAVMTIGSAAVAVYTLATGRVVRLNLFRWRPGWLLAAFFLMLLLGWGYKIAVGLATGALPYGR
jgi:hypothetical protein